MQMKVDEIVMISVNNEDMHWISPIHKLTFSFQARFKCFKLLMQFRIGSNKQFRACWGIECIGKGFHIIDEFHIGDGPFIFTIGYGQQTHIGLRCGPFTQILQPFWHIGRFFLGHYFGRNGCIENLVKWKSFRECVSQ